MLAATVLGRPDIDCVHVESADGAVEAAARARPHMVVIDLPRAEAVALVRGLRQNELTRPTAIVWLNRTDPPDAETELAVAGANAVITLPVDPFLWDRRLEELLSVPARRTERFPVRLRDWSRFVSGADEDEGSVVNIGARGVLLESPRELELGTKVGLTFDLPGQGSPVGVVGQVARLAGEEGGLFRVGIEFLVYRGDARERIAAFVEAETPPDRPGAPAAVLPLTVRPFEEAREWEEELRASEIRKALILDSALDCILTADHEGRVIEFNAAARRLFGYSRSEILGREVADTIVPPALRDELRRCLRDFVLTGESSDLGRRREATAMRADGSLVPVEVVVVPAYVKGRVILTAYIRDLSDRRRGERLATARQRATQALTASLSLAEASPAVLDALVHGLDCTEARLWVADGDPPAPSLAGTSSGAPAALAPAPPDDSLARRTLEDGAAAWDGPPPRGAGVALAVPVRVGGQVLGVLEVRCERARSRDADWVPALADIGSLLALFLKRQRAEADLQRFARYDSLTGLPNRSFFLDTLDRTLSRAGRQRTRSALVFIDLDGFKAVNDGLGHAAGDTVLQTMAERLRAGTRSSDLVARIGGDEFTVLVQNLARADDAALVARGLLDRLARPCRADDHDVTHQRERRHQRLPRRRHRGRHAAPQRGPRDVPGEAGRQEHLPLLHRGDERARPRAHAAPRQPAGGPRAGRVRDRLPARPPPRGAAVARGPPEMAAPQARDGDAGRLHRPGRGERPHPADRRRGPPRRHPVRRLARPEGRSRRRQPLGPAVPPAEPGRHRPGRRREERAPGLAPRAGPHRAHRDDRGRGDDGAAAPAPGAGRAAGPRRLRDRLLLDRAHPGPRLQPAEDRPLTRLGAARQPRAGRARRGHPRPGPQPRPRGRGGRRRDRGPARLPRVARLHRLPGLPAEPAPRRRRRPGLPGRPARSGRPQATGCERSGIHSREESGVWGCGAAPPRQISNSPGRASRAAPWSAPRGAPSRRGAPVSRARRPRTPVPPAGACGSSAPPPAPARRRGRGRR